MNHKVGFVTASLMLLVAIFGVSQIDSFAVSFRPNNMVSGATRKSSALVHSEQITIAGIARQNVTRNVKFQGTRNITLIQALDQFTNGTGGYAIITSGGVNQRSATINLRSSAPGRGLNFVINIYAL